MPKLELREAVLTGASIMPGGRPFETARAIPWRGSLEQFREDLRHAAGLLPWPVGALRRGLKVSFSLGIDVNLELQGSAPAGAPVAVDLALAQLESLVGVKA